MLYGAFRGPDPALGAGVGVEVVSRIRVRVL